MAVGHVVRETSDYRPDPHGEWDGISRAEAMRRLLHPPEPKPTWWSRLMDRLLGAAS